MLAGVYALARLADDWPTQRQQCIDVLCAYRMPEATGTGDNEVRSTIGRTIAAHLRPESRVSWSNHDFDFTGAQIHNAELSDTTFSGKLTSFAGTAFSGERTSFYGATFSGGRTLFGVIVGSPADETTSVLRIHARIESILDFRDAEAAGHAELDLSGAELFGSGQIVAPDAFNGWKPPTAPPDSVLS